MHPSRACQAIKYYNNGTYPWASDGSVSGIYMDYFRIVYYDGFTGAYSPNQLISKVFHAQPIILWMGSKILVVGFATSTSTCVIKSRYLFG